MTHLQTCLCAFVCLCNRLIAGNGRHIQPEQLSQRHHSLHRPLLQPQHHGPQGPCTNHHTPHMPHHHNSHGLNTSPQPAQACIRLSQPAQARIRLSLPVQTRIRLSQPAQALEPSQLAHALVYKPWAVPSSSGSADLARSFFFVFLVFFLNPASASVV